MRRSLGKCGGDMCTFRDLDGFIACERGECTGMRGKALPHLEISRGAICRVGLAGLTRESEDRRVVGYPAEWVIRGKREVKGISAFPLLYPMHPRSWILCL